MLLNRRFVDLFVNECAPTGVLRFAPGAMSLEAFLDDRNDARDGSTVEFQDRAIGTDRQRQHESLDTIHALTCRVLGLDDQRRGSGSDASLQTKAGTKTLTDENLSSSRRPASMW
jgi:hypothetical protein